MPCAITIALTCFLVELVHGGAGYAQTSTGVSHDPFNSEEDTGRLARKIEPNEEKVLSSRNNWGFSDGLTEWPEEDKEKTAKKVPEVIATTTPYYEEVDPNHNGLLKDIGTINVGFGVGVGVPGNDPVSVGARVGVGFGGSGLAGQLPIGQNIYPRQV